MNTEFSLSSYNTFGIRSFCKELIYIVSIDDLLSLDKEVSKQALILGGGSNILCASYIDAVVLKNEIKGIEIIKETDDHVFLKVGGGENWHQFVLYALRNNYGGLENMSLIPGTVGAAPVQNIGAYGVEQDQLFDHLIAIDLWTNEEVNMRVDDCSFAYRDSLFKSTFPGRFFITHVVYKLSKKAHSINVSYGAIEDELSRMGVDIVTIKAVSQAVINIRTFKLPDPEEIHNAGSFFKNPIVYKAKYEDLLRDFPNLISYALPEDQFKIPAGWLIDQCGFKGKRLGNVGAYKNQALVIVNHGEATGEEVWAFARIIQKAVMDKYDILLVPEVNRWGF